MLFTSSFINIEFITTTIEFGKIPVKLKIQIGNFRNTFL